MKQFALAMIAGISLAALGLTAAPTVAQAGDDCHRTEFKTKLVKAACKKGGQAEAKKVMKAFLKDAKKQNSKLNCQSCHAKLSPSYDLKSDALETFKSLGGK